MGMWNEVYKFEVMGEEEKKNAVQKMKNGDEKAREALITTNLRFVAERAGHYTGMGVDRDDLIAVGCNALVQHIDKYDPERGELTTCMAPYIEGAMKEELNRNARTIRLPKNVIAGIRKMRAAEHELMEELGRPATPGEIAAKMGCTLKKVQQLQSVGTASVSLDDKVSEDDDRTYGDIWTDNLAESLENGILRKEMILCIRHCFKQLDKNDQDLLTLTVIKRQKLSKIAANAGVSRQCIDQKKTRALKRLKKIIMEKYPELLAA